MFSVLIRERGGEGQIRTFEKPEVSIGRIQGNDIVLPKGNISKRHARIVNRDNDFVVVDLRSTNGTYVNGHRVSSPMVISKDDKLYIGDYILQVNRGEAAAEDIPADASDDADATRALEVESAEPPKPPPSATPPPMKAVEQPGPEPGPATMPAAQKVSVDEPTASNDSSVGHEETMAAPPAMLRSGGESEGEAYSRALDLLYDRAKRSIFAGLDLDNIDFESQWHELESAVFSLVETGRKSAEIPDTLDAAALTTDILYEFTALGPIEYFLADDSVTEIHVNAFNQLFTRRSARLHEERKTFSSPEALDTVVDRLIRTHGGDADERRATVKGRLDDGTAYYVVFPPLTPGGPVLTFVKPPLVLPTLQAWIESGGVTEDAGIALAEAMSSEAANVLVAGPELRANAELMGLLATEIPGDLRLAIVEGSPLVAMPQGNALRVDAEGPSSVHAASRLQADRIFGIDLLPDAQAELLHLAATTRRGVTATIEARDTVDLEGRLRALAGGAATSRENALRSIAAAFDYVVWVERGDRGHAVVQWVREVREDNERGWVLVS